MAYKLVIFDLDGTLVDTAPDIAASANRALVECGKQARSLSVARLAIGRGVFELLKGMSDAEGQEPLAGEELEHATKLFRKYYLENLVVESEIYEGVQEVLGGALAGVAKAIVTNKPHVLTQSFLDRIDLRKWFDPVIGAGAEYPAKPAPDGLMAAMKHHGAQKDETILIGDSRIDREAAANAGISFGWVSYGYDTLTCDGSFRVFKNARQWEDLIDE